MPFASKNEVFKVNEKSNAPEMGIALAGNPNVGKSTVFNALTGLHQHTGNWTGKTVSTARGRVTAGDREFTLTDLPGTYSLMAHSAEEQVARDFICFSDSRGVIVVCDGGCLERNLNLALQVMEITPHVLLCVNLLDEAEKKGIQVDIEKLESILHVPVCGTSARSGKGLDKLLSRLDCAFENTLPMPPVTYDENIERAAEILREAIAPMTEGILPPRFAALRILEESDITDTLDSRTGGELLRQLSDKSTAVGAAYERAREILREAGITRGQLRDRIVTGIVERAAEVAGECVTEQIPDYYERDRKIDRVLTHRIWGLPVMLLILTVIFFITIKLANYPSSWLAAVFSSLGRLLRGGLESIPAPPWVTGLLMDGVYNVLTWVASVMLPPMAIFFPMFTLLEDVGYLPRAAFNLDRYFSRASACGKQALTMAMGLGCNAAGITGCRIIDSPRERSIAVLTNNFMPCNGRFPIIIALSAAFFTFGGLTGDTASAVMVTAMILLGAFMTFACSSLLSKTILRGEKTSFALELPPYRRPQIGKVLVRSLLDRTVFVLGRAVTAAAPAGLIIWLMGNISAGDDTLLQRCADFLDPAGRFLGMDGAILLAFILGFPANEIVIPIMLMVYTKAAAPVDYEGVSMLGELLCDNGWTWVTALCTMIFMLCHFPCATACMTVKKETGSWRQTLLAAVIPTAAGIILCGLINGAAALFGM